MDVCNGSDLSVLKKARTKFKEPEVRLMTEQLVKGFAHIHSQRIAHRDIKLSNILIHFPERDFTGMSKDDFTKALKEIDLT